MVEGPGLVILIGSGETSPTGQQVFDWLFRRLPPPVRVAIVETPAGFEPNSAQVAGRVGEFLVHHLRNYRPQVAVVPARARGTAWSPDDPQIAGRVAAAETIYLGAGSPTYAARQLRDSRTWHTVLACHRLGAALVLASAAVIAVGKHVLPVYEIFKAGHELHWQPGLDLLGPYGLELVLVPHWNNGEGGPQLDTGRCFMGESRFRALLDLLPGDPTVVGIDEHTALVLDLSAGRGRVLGAGWVHLLRGRAERQFETGHAFPLAELGDVRRPEPPAGLQPDVWAQVRAARAGGSPPEPPGEVLLLLDRREMARARRDWAAADAIRDQIAALGWQVQDTPHGTHLAPADGAV